MGRAAVDQLLYLMDQAFEAHGEHGLLNNLRSLDEADWHWLPPGGGRSVFDLVLHVGECKYVYDSHAFGDGSMRWDRPCSVPSVQRTAQPEAINAWLTEGQRRLKASVAALADDTELLKPRHAAWGQDYETRWLINVVIQHDLYHGGEINHVRALHQQNDRWPWSQV